MVYSWKINKFPVDAQKAGEFLDKLEKREGKLEPKTIVEESKDSKSLLHKCFEWNNDTAADKYREVQAREIIRNIVVTKVNNTTSKPVTVRAFVNVENINAKKAYTSIETVVNNAHMKQKLLDNAKAELISFQKKYSDLKEFADLINCINTVLTKIV